MWLPYAAAEYARVTGDVDIWDENVPYIAGEELGSARERYMTVTQRNVGKRLRALQKVV